MHEIYRNGFLKKMSDIKLTKAGIKIHKDIFKLVLDTSFEKNSTLVFS